MHRDSYANGFYPAALKRHGNTPSRLCSDEESSHNKGVMNSRLVITNKE